MYNNLKNEEEHYRYDAETLLYEPGYKMLDMNSLIKTLIYQASNGQAGEKVDLSREQYETMITNLQHKNGFVMADFELTVMNAQLNDIKDLCISMLKLIDEELEVES